MRVFCVLGLLVACACPGKKSPAPSGNATVEVAPAAATCDGVKSKVAQLYRAEGEMKEPKRVDELVDDNTKMVMTDCAKDPAKFAPCIAKAQTVAELEKQCLVPLDDEGTEAEKR